MNQLSEQNGPPPQILMPHRRAVQPSRTRPSEADRLTQEPEVELPLAGNGFSSSLSLLTPDQQAEARVSTVRSIVAEVTEQSRVTPVVIDDNDLSQLQFVPVSGPPVDIQPALPDFDLNRMAEKEGLPGRIVNGTIEEVRDLTLSLLEAIDVVHFFHCINLGIIIRQVARHPDFRTFMKDRAENALTAWEREQAAQMLDLDFIDNVVAVAAESHDVGKLHPMMQEALHYYRGLFDKEKAKLHVAVIEMLLKHGVYHKVFHQVLGGHHFTDTDRGYVAFNVCDVNTFGIPYGTRLEDVGQFIPYANRFVTGADIFQAMSDELRMYKRPPFYFYAGKIPENIPRARVAQSELFNQMGYDRPFVRMFTKILHDNWEKGWCFKETLISHPDHLKGEYLKRFQRLWKLREGLFNHDGDYYWDQFVAMKARRDALRSDQQQLVLPGGKILYLEVEKMEEPLLTAAGDHGEGARRRSRESTGKRPTIVVP